MNKTLFVAGVPAEFENSMVADLFGRFGTVESVRRINDKRNVELSILFVTMETVEEVNEVLQHKFTLGGNELTVMLSRPQKDRLPQHDNRGGYRSERPHFGYKSERPRFNRNREENGNRW